MADNSVTPPRQDETLSYRHWIKTLDAIERHPSSDEMVKQLASMCRVLVQLGRHDPHIGVYLNQQASEAMEAVNGD